MWLLWFVFPLSLSSFHLPVRVRWSSIISPNLLSSSYPVSSCVCCYWSINPHHFYFNFHLDVFIISELLFFFSFHQQRNLKSFAKNVSILTFHCWLSLLVVKKEKKTKNKTKWMFLPVSPAIREKVLMLLRILFRI